MKVGDIPITELTLRERLTHCYTRPDDARMVADEAGLPVARIDFSGPMAVVWWRVCDEAGKSPVGLHRLRTRAGKDYPDAFPPSLAPPPPQADAALERWLSARWRALRQVRLLGYRRKDRVRLTLDEVFVSLRTHVVRRDPMLRPMRYDPEAEAAHGVDEPLDLPGALAYMERRGARGLALVGEPGAGKTTLLKHLFCRVRAEGSQAVGLPPGLVPVLLRCAAVEKGDRAPGGLADVIRRTVMREGSSAAATALASGDLPLLVLLDGLDEVPDRDTRRAVSAWLEDEIGQWPRCRFVITCRFTAWRDGARLSGRSFVEAHIAWLSLARVRAYVRRWYFAVVVGQDHASPEEAEARAEALARTLLDPEKQRRYRLRQMIQNPLMLATLCLVHYAGNRLPERRADLYDECIGFLLETWAAQGGRQGVPDKPAREVLKPLAWALHERQAEAATGDETRPLAVHRDELKQIIAAPYRQVTELDLSLDDFLARIRDDCGLFSGVDEERYEFLHLSFQEYLAARHAIDENRVGDLADRVGEPFWREVIMLALSDRAAYGPFMTRVVQRRQVAAHAELLREAFTLAPKLDPAPFLPALRRPRGLWGRLGAWLGGGSDAGEVQAILGLFRGREAPEVRAAAEAWVDAEQPGVAAAAAALLRPAGEAPSQASGPTGIEWVHIPGGTFWMGSSDDRQHPAYDPQSNPWERPPRRVTISRGYWMSRHPVTNDDYRAFVEATGRDAPSYWSDPELNQPRQPVTGVDWRDARAFAEWLGAAGGLPVPGGRVDLPTEAEWEYAARGAEGRRYPWGDAAPSTERANYGKSSGGLHLVGAHPAGATPDGVEDMAGGVWEWCLDIAADDYSGWPAAVTDPRREDDHLSALRVLRGGSWIIPSQYLRAALRVSYDPRYRDRFIGFRVVCRVSREHG